MLTRCRWWQKTSIGSWQSVEACLWAVRSISSNVPNDEGETMPQVVQVSDWLAPFFKSMIALTQVTPMHWRSRAMLQQVIMSLPDHPNLRSSANHIVGRYSRWIRNHANSLQVRAWQ